MGLNDVPRVINKNEKNTYLRMNRIQIKRIYLIKNSNIILTLQKFWSTVQKIMTHIRIFLILLLSEEIPTCVYTIDQNTILML